MNEFQFIEPTRNHQYQIACHAHNAQQTKAKRIQQYFRWMIAYLFHSQNAREKTHNARKTWKYSSETS